MLYRSIQRTEDSLLLTHSTCPKKLFRKVMQWGGSTSRWRRVEGIERKNKLVKAHSLKTVEKEKVVRKEKEKNQNTKKKSKDGGNFNNVIT